MTVSHNRSMSVLIALLLALAVFSPDILAQSSSLPQLERGVGWVVAIFSPGVIIGIGTVAFLAIGILFLTGKLEIRGAAVSCLGVLVLAAAPWLARTLFNLFSGG